MSMLGLFQQQLAQWKELEREALAAEMHAALFVKSRDNSPEAMRAVDHSIELREKADDFLSTILGVRAATVMGTPTPVNDAGQPLQ